MHEEADRLLKAAQKEGTPAEEVLDLCRRAFAFAPEAPDVFRIALCAMSARAQLRECHDLVNEAIARHPSDATIVEAYATWLEYQGNFDVAVPYWRRYERLAPHADPHSLRLARALLYGNDLQGAVALLSPFLEQFGAEQHQMVSKGHAIFGEALLKAGNPVGFQHYLYRISANAGYYEIPGVLWWNGHELSGKKILITHHLGYGDQLLLASVIPHLLAQGATVGITLDTAISALVQYAFPQVSVFAAERACIPQQAPSSEILEICSRFNPDYQSTVLHLPLLALHANADKTTLFQPYLIAPVPALHATSQIMDQVRAVAAGRKIIGIAWDCIQRHYGVEHGEYVASFSARRSISTAQISALIDDRDIREKYHFVALHPQSHFGFIHEPLPQNISLIGSAFQTFSDTTAIIERCDSVVSIDMSMANLASFMHKDTTLLLQHEGEWRFGISGERSPWLTGPLCIRQQIPGDWGPVLETARTHLLMKALSHAPVLHHL